MLGQSIKSVIFAPFTNRSELTTSDPMKRKLFQLTRTHYKIVERGEIKLQDILTASNLLLRCSSRRPSG